MGRKPIGKKAMTAAQRQRKHRRKTAKATREAEMAVKRERNMARFQRDQPAAWTVLEWLAIPRLENSADEVAFQIAEFLRDRPDITIDDVRAAIDRRFGA